MSPLAIVNGTLIDGTGADPVSGATLVIDEDRVRAVLPASEPVPDGAEVVDAAGGFVIPGLMDANVHLCPNIPDILLRYENRYTDLITEGAQLTLKAGVTTVFDTYGSTPDLLAVRDGIERGELTGSRMYVAGQIIGYPGPLTAEPVSLGNLLGARTIERLERRFDQGLGQNLTWLPAERVGEPVREYIERTGVDFIKYAACMHDVPLIVFSERAQRAIVDAAHHAGRTVQAHTMSVESLRMEVEAGADLLTHPNVTGYEPIPDDLLETIVERQLPAAALLWTKRYDAYALENWSERERALFGEPTYENGGRMIAAGARMLMTTDSMISVRRKLGHAMAKHSLDSSEIDYPFDLGDSHALWFVAASEHGMPPMEALLSATKYVAEAYGKDADLGTLELGKKADLLILATDPLQDPYSYGRITEVFKDGTRVDRDALPDPRVLTAPE
jgi:imidazolonepropionase-like amidohydrolase